MYSEEETELRDLILQNLETSGFLNKIKAELRAGVLLAFEENGNLKNKVPLLNRNIDDFVKTFEGKLLLSLVREFLEYFNLQFTLSVFDPEVSATTPCVSRSELCEKLNLNNSEIDEPVISALLKGEINKARDHNFVSKLQDEINPAPNNSVTSNLTESTTKDSIQDDVFNTMNVLNKESLNHNFEKDHVAQTSSKEELENTPLSSLDVLTKINAEASNNAAENDLQRAIPEKSGSTEKNDMFKVTKDIMTPDDDSFFDEPLPSEKPSYFSFVDKLKDKSENKQSISFKADLDESKKGSLSSLRDLPSLTANNEWTFSRGLQNTLPSLDSQKSVSSSETSNEEIINLDSKEELQKKDSDIVESNEESSEKQNSEESIEEELEEDFSAGFDDLLNSSLSLADDATTDQTVSQVSVVEGVDHVEPCNS